MRSQRAPAPASRHNKPSTWGRNIKHIVFSIEPLYRLLPRDPSSLTSSPFGKNQHSHQSGLPCFFAIPIPLFTSPFAFFLTRRHQLLLILFNYLPSPLTARQRDSFIQHCLSCSLPPVFLSFLIYSVCLSCCCMPCITQSLTHYYSHVWRRRCQQNRERHQDRILEGVKGTNSAQ